MTKPLWYRWARVYVTGFSIVATGVLLYNYTVPTDEELIARFLPENRANYERNRKLRQLEQQELMRIAQETAASKDPVWKTGKIQLPFEKDTRGIDPKLVDKPAFFQQEQDDVRRQEVDRARAELAEAEQLKKKKWWFW